MRFPRSLGPAALFLAASCAPASYPDAPAVASAQVKWCQVLAKVNGAGSSWDHLGECNAARPTSAGPYLAKVATCFGRRHEELGKKPYDQGQMSAECNDEVTMSMPVDDRLGGPIIEARCERALRCEKVPTATCKESLAKLEISQRALLYGVYNAATVHQIADCVRASSCETDEDAARAACYKQPSEKLIWFP